MAPEKILVSTDVLFPKIESYLSSLRVEFVVDRASVLVGGTNRRRGAASSIRSGCGVVIEELDFDFGTGDHRAALVLALLDCTVLADRLGEGTHAQIAHQHTVVASTVQAGLVRHDAVTLAVVVVVVVAARRFAIIFQVSLIALVHGCCGTNAKQFQLKTGQIFTFDKC